MGNHSGTDEIVWIKNISLKKLNGFPGLTSGDATHGTDTPDDQTMSNILTLDGSDDYLATEADSTLATRTYSFWCRTSITTANGGLFGHGAPDHGGFHINPHFTGAHEDKPIIYLGSSYYRYFEDTPAQDDGTWHHWAVYMDHTDITNCTVHVDGVALSVEQTVSSGSADAWTTGLTIGKTTGYFFRGHIDQFAVFDTELAADAVASLAGEMWEQGDTYTTNWAEQGTNSIDVNDGAVRVTSGGLNPNDDGIRIDLAKTADGGALNSSIIPGRTYKLTCEMKVGSGDTVALNLGEAIQSSAITSTTFVTVTLYYTPDATYPHRDHLRFNDLNAGGEAWIKSISLIDTEARKNDLTQTIGNYDSDWTDNLINYWKMGDGNYDEPQEGIIHDQANSGYGAELITDGTFDATLTDNWTGENDCAEVVAGALKITDVGGSNNRVTQDIDLDTYVGKTLKLEYDVLSSSGLGSNAFKAYLAGAYTAIPQTDGHHVVYWTQSPAGLTNFYFNLMSQDDGDYIIIDNVSVKVLNGDPGMTTSGATIIKQPV